MTTLKVYHLQNLQMECFCEKFRRVSKIDHLQNLQKKTSGGFEGPLSYELQDFFRASRKRACMTLVTDKGLNFNKKKLSTLGTGHLQNLQMGALAGFEGDLS